MKMSFALVTLVSSSRPAGETLRLHSGCQRLVDSEVERENTVAASILAITARSLLHQV